MIYFRWATVLATVLLLHSGVLAQEPSDQLGIPGPLEFDGTTYRLAFVAQPSAEYIKQEYVPEGQTPQTFTDMILVETLVTDMDVKAMAAAKVAELKARKATDPVVNFDILENAARNEIIVDFLVSGKTADGKTIIEWNAYRYKALEGTPPRMMLFGVSRRGYDEQARPFLANLGSQRSAEITVLANHELPQPPR